MRKNVLDAINRLYTASMAAIHDSSIHGGFGSICNLWRIPVQDGRSLYDSAAQGAEEDANQIMGTINDMAHEIGNLESQLRLIKLSKNAKAVLQEMEKAQKETKKAREAAFNETSNAQHFQEQLDKLNDELAKETKRANELRVQVHADESDRKKLMDRYFKTRHERTQALTEKADAEKERDEAFVKLGSMTLEVEKLRAEVELLRPKSPIGRTRRKLDIQHTS